MLQEITGKECPRSDLKAGVGGGQERDGSVQFWSLRKKIFTKRNAFHEKCVVKNINNSIKDNQIYI